MTTQGASKLYTPEILGLAMDLSQYPLIGAWSFTGRARSRSCGSIVEMGLDIGSDDTVTRLGLSVTACATGQAAAAIFAHSAVGRSPRELAEIRQHVDAWLREQATQPTWPNMAILEPAREYPARHDAIMLPWRAADAALSNVAMSR